MGFNVLNGNPARYNATLPTLSDGDACALMVDSRGRLIIAATVLTGEQIEITNDSGNPIPVSGTTSSAVLQTAATAVGNGTSISLSGVAAGNLAITGTFVGTVTFEVQDAAGAWNSVMLQAIGTSILASSTTTTGVWRMPVGGFSAFRARISAYTSGSITATAFVENTAYTPAIQNAALYDRLDATNDAITTYPLGHSFLNIAAGQATTTVKSGAGVLEAIVFNGPATATNTTTVYDNTAASGTVIAIPLATAIVGPTTVRYGIAFSTGLTIITATANGANMTVVYR